MKLVSLFSGHDRTSKVRHHAPRVLAPVIGALAIAALMTLPVAAQGLSGTPAVPAAAVNPTTTSTAVAPAVTAATVAPAPATTATTDEATAAPATVPAGQAVAAVAAASVPTTTAVPVTVAPVDDCAVALAYLAANAKPGFALYCRPGPLAVGITDAVAYTCVPGAAFTCPDGVPEIIIADPTCAASYMNEASNSFWDFSTGGVITPGSTQNGRTWDPYGECP